MALPPINYTAPSAQPAGRGLVSVATVIDVPPPARLSGGATITGSNCTASYGQWPADPCADTTGMDKQPGPVGESAWPAVVAWGSAECDPDESERELRERAEHDMQIGARLIVEEVFYREALQRLPAPSGGGGIVDVVARMEAALGQTGIRGVIHAPRALAAHAEYAGLVRHSGSRPTTPLGHYWSFGAGYAAANGADQRTVVATSPVFVWRSEVTTSVAVEPTDNVRTAVAERTLVAGVECVVDAANVQTGGGSGSSTLHPSQGVYPSASTFPGEG